MFYENQGFLHHGLVVSGSMPDWAQAWLSGLLEKAFVVRPAVLHRLPVPSC